MEKKSDVIRDIAERSGQSQTTVEAVLTALGDSVEANIEEQEKYSLGSLGKLVLRQSAARKGRNPGTGDEINIPAKKTIALRPSSTIKAALNA
ncbi:MULTISPECIES: HU family DNA-binding protein [Halomonadaceae]|uniref:HU family DNA-binding protein n=1 Tax=Halomonas campaniensis TaxID=213554 RepID=A0A3D0KGL0_9GAMM|nr:MULTISPECIES: HU family DNA-binding protein [unclassified Halomonas]HCA02668.1 hypothetical protein [Halomonas campaniensis]